jgi:hypothetical protein
MRILVDMNLTPRWVNHLSYSGYETIHWSSIGPATAKDREIFDYARQHGFIILTNDLDFPQLLAHTMGGAAANRSCRKYAVMRSFARYKSVTRNSPAAPLFRWTGRIGPVPGCYPWVSPHQPAIAIRIILSHLRFRDNFLETCLVVITPLSIIFINLITK